MGPIRASTESDHVADEYPNAEHLRIDERLVVSTAHGVFEPVATGSPQVGDGVGRGQVLATVGSTKVESPFEGRFMGWLAFPGERVRRNQPIAWLAPDRPVM